MVRTFQSGESFSPFLLISWDSVRFVQTPPPTLPAKVFDSLMYCYFVLSKISLFRQLFAAWFANIFLTFTGKYILCLSDVDLLRRRNFEENWNYSYIYLHSRERGFIYYIPGDYLGVVIKL